MNALTAQNIELLLPCIAKWSLVLCASLWSWHCVRLFRCWPRCPKRFQYKEECADLNESRAVIRNENELLNQRLLWLMTAEGLLFTALGFALSSEDVALKQNLITVLSFVGILLGASASIILDAADAAIIRWSYQSVFEIGKGDVIGYRGIPLVGLLAPWRVYPPMFIAAWYIISQM